MTQKLKVARNILVPLSPTHFSGNPDNRFPWRQAIMQISLSRWVSSKDGKATNKNHTYQSTQKPKERDCFEVLLFPKHGNMGNSRTIFLC
jgi:hypothetical protein